MAGRYGMEDHTADLGLWVEADSLTELFASAVGALAEIMVLGGRQGQVQWLPLNLEGADLAELLVALLNEVVYRLDAEGLVAVALEVSELTPVSLAGRLGVIPFDPARHQRGEPVKAVTYHEATVEPVGDGFRAHVVMDV